MGFGWPLGLAALAALLVPLLIHLARQRPSRPIRVGSLRHLPAAAAPRRARSRIVEPWLLALRLLILALLALCIARPFVRHAPPARAPRSLVVVPAGIPDDSLRALFPAADSLLSAGAELHRTPMADLWSELAEIDANLPEGSTIAIAALLHLRIAGARPALRSSVSLHRIILQQKRAGRESAPGRTLRVGIAADSLHRIAAQRVAAAFRAVAEMRGDSLILLEPSGAAKEGWLVWLSDSAPPPAHLDAARAGATLLTSGGPEREAASDGVAVERLGRGRIISAPAVAFPSIDGAFPELIARIWPDPSAFSPAEPEPRRMSTSQLLPSRAIIGRAGTPQTEIGRILLALAAALFLLERWVAHRRTTEVSA